VLGNPNTWQREEVWEESVGELVLGPVAVTGDPGWIALYTRAGQVAGVAPRLCPHRGADLIANASYGECPGALTCKHRGLAWRIDSGEPLSTPRCQPGPAIALRPFELGTDGQAYILIEPEEAA
jgi:nitrite reductase/ring-hydroxylating ferredoxin subunit